MAERKLQIKLTDEIIVELDQAVVDIRREQSAIVSRTDLIAAILSAITESSIDFSTADSAAAVKKLIAKKLK